jgi:pantetheine-phosphate adenylyltransferase
MLYAGWTIPRRTGTTCLGEIPNGRLIAGATKHKISFTFLRGILKRVIAIYPGSFDPPTNGHLDLIQRGARIFDELVVAILQNSEKAPLFSLEERLEMLRECTSPFANVCVESFGGLLVDYARDRGAQAVLRGIRAVSDYEYELQMAWMNRKLDPSLETVFMMPAGAYSYLSSRLVREIASLGGTLGGLVPASVESRLRERFRSAPLASK